MSYPTTTMSLDFLSGGGEMGERIRNYDWSQTALGKPEQWNQSLKTSVSICLNSNFPIALYWGRELLLLYNDAWSSIPGNKHPQALGKPAREVWSDIWSAIEPEFEKAFRGIPGGSKDALLPMHRHGYTEECYFDFTFTPVTGDSGKVEGVFNAVIETTYRILTERRTLFLANLTQLLAACNNSGEVFQKLISFIADNNKPIPFALLYSCTNDKCELELSTHPADKINIKDHFQPGLFSPDQKIIYLDDLHAYFNEVPRGYWPEEPVEAIQIPLWDATGNLYHFLVCGVNPRHRFDAEFRIFFESISNIVSNILQTISSIEEQRKRADALAEIDKAKTIFFTNISHEFRTPLTLMLGSIEEARQNNNIPVVARQHMEVAHRNSLRLLRLVNALLDFSRIESGRQQATYMLTDIVQFTKNLAANFRSVIEKAALQFQVNADTVIRPVYLDRQMYEKIVFNLLSNAIKYTFKGKITLTLSTNAQAVILEVKDTGTGIPSNELPYIFDRFHRVENAKGRSIEGTGIGLSLTRELVLLHGGTITVNSKENKGSAFTVSIPFGKDHLPATKIIDQTEQSSTVISDVYLEEAAYLFHPELNATETAGSPGGTASHSTHADTILVVDDNADMRQHIGTVLQKTYRVITAANGMDALHKIKEHKPSLILSDIMMPVMDGVQLLKEVKSNPAINSIPVILLTARAGEESRIEGYDMGADDYLVKPFSAKELLARIQAQVKIKHQQVQVREKIEQSERELQEKVVLRTAELEKSQKHFALLFNVSPVAKTITNLSDGTIRDVNPAWEKLFGISRNEAIGKSISQLDLFSSRHHAKIAGELSSNGGSWHGFELEFEQPGGKKIITYTSAVSIELDEVPCYLTAYFDITERKDYEKQIMEASAVVGKKNVELERMNKELESFNYITSHDLQEPLRKIRTFINLVEKNKFEAGYMEKYLEKINSSATRMSKLIQSVLDYTRLSNVKEETVEVDLNEVLADIKDDFELLIEEKKAIILSNQLPVIKGNPLQMHQLFANLISNSLKFSAKQPRIEIMASEINPGKISKEQKFIQLRFSDNGIGFDPEFKEKIFEVFQRLHGRTEYSGTGIGLSIVRKIVEGHGGTVSADSKPGEGTVFTIWLPVAE